MGRKKVFEFNATLVANEFIDKYMPDANGDYVKVYLYLLKCGSDNPDIPSVADKLHLTEGDIRRAIKFWSDKGLLDEPVGKDTSERALSEESALTSTADIEELLKTLDSQDELRSKYRNTEGRVILDRLETDGEFAQLLFIVQKYLSKILTEKDQEVMAYLYDGLKLPYEVIDYLVEYCVSTGHTNMRYIETVGLDWASRGIKTVRAAKKLTDSFDEIAKNATQRRKRSKNSILSQGITRDTDLDGIVKNQVLKGI